jgi:L-lysine 2,3-aminomutase
LLRSFEEIVGKGYHVALTAHFSHPVEMGPAVVRTAVKRIQSTGAIIRTQAAIVRHVNDSADAWTILWRTAVSMGMVPYYVFIPRDTGPRRYLQVPPAEARRVFRRAFRRVSGLARTVRGTVHVGPPGQGSTARCQQDRWSQSVRPAVPVGEKPGLGG